ncbi:MAG: hypothetical protein IKS83_04260 [Victivallales bacterium]|nr:hypothetical protein [Victivallales bacterium]
MKDSLHKCFLTVCCLLGWMTLTPPLLSAADESARAHLEQASRNMVTRTMQVTECVQDGMSRVERLIMQRRLPDGTVERVTERLVNGARRDPETLRIDQHVLRIYYGKDGCVDLRVGMKSVRGIRSRREIPMPKFRRECAITEEKRIYGGRFCWDITVRNPTAKGILVEEYLVSGSSQMPLVYRRFDADGRLLLSVFFRDYDFSPEFPEGVFKLPENAVVREAREGEDKDDLRQELLDAEKEEKEEFYEQKVQMDLKADLRYLFQGMMACLVAMLTWVAAPLAMAGVAFLLFRKSRGAPAKKRN